MKVSLILILITMNQEAQPIIEYYNLQETQNIFAASLPMKAYEGEVDGIKVVLVINGLDKENQVSNVATQPATLAAYEAIRLYNPDLVINGGTAGAFSSKGAEIGDVYLGEGELKYHDRRIPLPGFDKYGIGSYSSIDITEIAETLNFKMGIVSTGNSLDMTDVDLMQIKQNDATLKDMEAAAIGWVAELYNKPLIVMKSVTDILDGEKPSAEEFVENLTMASENLKFGMIKLIDYIAEQETIPNDSYVNSHDTVSR